ncbi:MAG TPA: ABC transporter ATP-binding protein [Pseudothermotoga sp.]|nr:ABC transporter ATP-binding protein [Pseudothermotoga sp.]
MVDVALKSVSFRYNSKQGLVLNGTTLFVEHGEFVGLLGPNGSGKTTMLRIIAGLFPVSDGEVKVCGMNPLKIGRKKLAKIVGFVTQDFIPIYDYTVKQIVLSGRLPYAKTFFSTWTDKDLEAVKEALRKVDAERFIERSFHSLSTGEQKRVAMARILAQNTPVILLDEPTAHLDPGHVVEIKNVLAHLHKEGKTIIAAFHDVNIASELCTRIVFMKSGKILFDGPPEKIITEKTLELIYDTKFHVIKNPETGKLIVVY